MRKGIYKSIPNNPEKMSLDQKQAYVRGFIDCALMLSLKNKKDKDAKEVVEAISTTFATLMVSTKCAR